MNLTATHPLYIDYTPSWLQVRDAYAGEDSVKLKGTAYLPATSGMVADGMGTSQPGLAQYNAYKTRAVFPDLVKQAVEAMVGLMHRKPAEIKVPKGMEGMLQNATLNGESIQVLLRRVNEEQLLTGRIGLSIDVPDNAGPTVLPYLCTYYAESIRNWDTSKDVEGRDRLSMVILDESGFKRDENLNWQLLTAYRLMVSGATATEIGALSAAYATGTSENGDDLLPETLLVPTLGGRPLDQIPFVIIGSKDLLHKPDVPPLLSVARLAFTCYRGEADYRQALFLQAQETLAIIGASEPDDGETRRVGAGSVIELPIGGDAKYVGVSAAGLAEQRSALENDYGRAASAGSQLLEARGKSAESGDALRVRVAARTATLSNIAIAGAAGLEEALRIAAKWRGLNPDEVSVKPNLDFTEEAFNIQDLVYFMDARERGVPLSLESIHNYCKKRGITDEQFEEELLKIVKEQAFAKKLLGPPTKAAEMKNATPPGGGPGGGKQN